MFIAKTAEFSRFDSPRVSSRTESGSQPKFYSAAFASCESLRTLLFSTLNCTTFAWLHHFSAFFRRGDGYEVARRDRHGHIVAGLVAFDFGSGDVGATD
jgi:hypothetical protein